MRRWWRQAPTYERVCVPLFVIFALGLMFCMTGVVLTTPGI